MPGNRRLDREAWFHARHPNDTSGRIRLLEVNEEAADFHGACPLRSAECVKNSSVFPRLCCPRQRVFLNRACRVYRVHLSIHCRKQSLVLTIDQNIQNGRCAFSHLNPKQHRPDQSLSHSIRHPSRKAKLSVDHCNRRQEVIVVVVPQLMATAHPPLSPRRLRPSFPGLLSC